MINPNPPAYSSFESMFPPLTFVSGFDAGTSTLADGDDASRVTKLGSTANDAPVDEIGVHNLSSTEYNPDDSSMEAIHGPVNYPFDPDWVFDPSILDDSRTLPDNSDAQ
jgi:hypothetical protein